MAKGYHKPGALQRRQQSFDTSGLASKGGYKRPGSNKKG